MKILREKNSLIKIVIFLAITISTIQANRSFTFNMYKQTMKPYVVNGIKYYPKDVSIGKIFKGVASWYGTDFHGRSTASGEKYNMYNLTAAHKTLPLNTLIKVTNIKNNKTVTVRVNDRGPFVKKRQLDLSYGAAKKLGIIDQGITDIKIKVLSTHIKKRKNVIGGIKTQSFKRKFFKNQNGKIQVQIASFSSKERTVNFIKTRNLKRFSPKVFKVVRERKTLYKVVVNKFKTHKEAKKFIKNGRFKGAYIVDL